MDIAFMVKYSALYGEAILLTLKLCAVSTVFSLLIGLFCAMARYFKVPALSPIAGGYISLSRNTPLLIQLFFLYFALPRLGVKLPAETCAITGLSFLGGGYMAEAFRGGLEAVGKGQIEAGLCVGLSRFQLARYVVLPQAAAVALPGLGANVIFLLKETSIVSVVALEDLMFVAKDLIGLYYKTNEALFMLVIAYLIPLLPLSFLLRYVERRLRYAGFGR
jgi:polar amino acid transport system permease protein